MPQQFIKAKQVVSNQANGLLEINSSGKIDMSFLSTGVANGVATLDASGNINADLLNGQDYEEIVVNLNGSFNTDEQARIARVGNIVSLRSITGPWSHGSVSLASTLSSIPTVVPSTFSPTGGSASAVFYMDLDHLGMITISNGLILIRYRDWTGAQLNRTSTTVAPAISWVI